MRFLLLLALVAAPTLAHAQAPGQTPVRPTDRLQHRLDTAIAARDELRARFERFGAHGRPDMPQPLSESPGDPPFEGAAWETGEWAWTDGRWMWSAGHWVAPDMFDDVSVDYASYDPDGPNVEDPNPDLGVGYNDGAFDGLYLEDCHEHHIRTASRAPMIEGVRDKKPTLIIRDHRHVGGSEEHPSSRPHTAHSSSGSSGSGSSSSDSGRWTNDKSWSSSNDSKSDNKDPDSNKDVSGVGMFTHGR